MWPENASDIDPLRNPDADAAIRSAVDVVRAPILLGAVLREPSPMISNVSLFYRPGGGEPERYVKQHPVPFAEYIPFRSFFRTFSDKVDLVTARLHSGRQARGRSEVPTPAGAPYWAIPTICFEVAYDDLMRDSTLQPGKRANILVVQTNNATFGYTAESEQQFAISAAAGHRARAFGRPRLHGGGERLHQPRRILRGQDLAVHRRGGPWQSRGPYRGLTVSDRIGDAPEYVAAGLAVLLAGLALGARRAGR